MYAFVFSHIKIGDTIVTEFLNLPTNKFNGIDKCRFIVKGFYFYCTQFFNAIILDFR